MLFKKNDFEWGVLVLIASNITDTIDELDKLDGKFWGVKIYDRRRKFKALLKFRSRTKAGAS